MFSMVSARTGLWVFQLVWVASAQPEIFVPISYPESFHESTRSPSETGWFVSFCCTPDCQFAEAILDELAAQWVGKVAVGRPNCCAAPPSATTCNYIQGENPTFRMFKDGTVEWSASGSDLIFSDLVPTLSQQSGGHEEFGWCAVRHVTLQKRSQDSKALPAQQRTFQRLPVETARVRFDTNGVIVAITVVGDLAYIVTGKDLRIFNVRNHSQPMLVGSFVPVPSSGDIVFAVAVDSNKDLAFCVTTLASELGKTFVLVVDVSNPALPRQIARFPTNNMSLAILDAATLYLPSTSGLEILDVSDPSQPKTLNVSDKATFALVVANGLMYKSESQGLSIADVRNPRNPVVLSFTRTEVDEASLLRVNSGMAYISSASELVVVNVSNPRNPVILDRLPPLADPDFTSLFVLGGIVYLGDRQKRLTMVNARDPQNLVELAVVPNIGINIFVQNGVVYGVASDLVIAESSDVVMDTAPSLVRGGNFSVLNPQDISVQNGFAYLLLNRSLVILDVSDPGHLVPVGSFSFDSGMSNMFVVDSLAFVAGERFTIVNVTDPTHPKQMYQSPVGPYAHIFVTHGLAYLVESRDDVNGVLHVFDVRDPANPTVRGSYQTNHITTIFVAHNIAYVELLFEVVILDVSDLANMVRIASIPESTNEIFVEYDLAYLATFSDVLIYNVTVPSNPVLVSQHPLTSPGPITAKRKITYVASGLRKLVLLDGPANPRNVGTIEFNQPLKRFSVADDGVVYALLQERVQVYTPTGPALHPRVSRTPQRLEFVVTFGLVSNGLELDISHIALLRVVSQTSSGATQLPSWCSVDLNNPRIVMTPPSPANLHDIRRLTTTFSTMFTQTDLQNQLHLTTAEAQNLVLDLISSGYVVHSDDSVSQLHLTARYSPQAGVLLPERFASRASEVNSVLGQFYMSTVARMEFELFNRTNHPAVWPQLQNQRLTTDLPKSFRLNLTDVDHDIAISVVGVPFWLQFDSASKMFSGTPPGDQVNSEYTIKVSANDGFSEAFGTFKVVVVPPKNRPASTVSIVAGTVSGFFGIVCFIFLVLFVRSRIREKHALVMLVSNVAGLTQYLHTHRKHKKPIVFISYTWGGTNDEVADALEKSLKHRGWLVIRDKHYIEPGDMISDFMNLITHPSVDAVIPIFSDKYFKSDNCLYEVVTMLKTRSKIIPIRNDLSTEESAKLFDPTYRHGIFEYWKDKQSKYEKLVSENPGDSTHALRWRNAGHAVIEIQEFIAEFALQLSVSAKEQISSDFAQVVESVETRRRRSASQKALNAVRAMRKKRQRVVTGTDKPDPRSLASLQAMDDL